MRKVVVLLFCFTLISCENRIDPKLLIGSWKMRDVIDNTNMNVSDKTTFCDNDSIFIETYSNNKLFESIRGIYKLNSKTNILSIKIHENVYSNSEIIKLTKTELHVKDRNTGKIIRGVKY